MNTVYVLALRDVVRFFRQWSRIFGSIVTPLIILAMFGAGIGGVMHSGWIYVQFILAGVITNTLILSTNVSSASLIWDREFGFLKIILLAPTRKTWIVLGKILGGALQALIQGSFFLLFAPLIGLHLSAGQILAITALLFVFSIGLAALSTAIASRSSTYESYNTWMLFLYMPMLFISGAFFVIADYPEPMRTMARCNPASYGIDALKNVILSDEVAVRWVPDFSLGTDLVVLAGFVVLAVALAVAFFQRQESP